jgi:hypothetical protein
LQETPENQAAPNIRLGSPFRREFENSPDLYQTPIQNIFPDGSSSSNSSVARNDGDEGTANFVVSYKYS